MMINLIPRGRQGSSVVMMAITTLVLSLTLIALFPNGAQSLECYCRGHCPHHIGHNGTCTTKSYCFIHVEEVVNPQSQEYETETLYGCMPEEESGLMQCRGNLSPHDLPKNINCCNDRDMCNKYLPEPKLPRRTQRPGYGGGEFLSFNDGFHPLALIVSVTITVVVIILLFWWHRGVPSNKGDGKQLETGSELEEDRLFIPPNKSLNDMIEQSVTSGSGSGLPFLVQKTIARDVSMKKIIGKGRYGEVWLGEWRGERVAVKVFFTTEEPSWRREREVYENMLVRDDHILGYIASDIRGKDFTQFLLITSYHEKGSLYDYLQSTTLTLEEGLRLMRSASAGLDFLHSGLHGRQIRPPIAHRDIKSKNILVKDDGTCCIADFGLAVCLKDNEINVPPENNRVGTKRYMAPEVLNETLNVTNFDAFKMADVYSFSLVLWEILTRIEINGEAEEYEIPYANDVPSDPSFEEMKKVVVIEGMRPEIPRRCEQHEILHKVSKLITESWHGTPSCRLTALRIKKDLEKLRVTLISMAKNSNAINNQQRNKISMV